MLGRAVRSAADCAQAVQGRHAQSGSEISVGAASDRHLAQRKTKLLHQPLRMPKKSANPSSTFQRRAVHPAGYFKVRARQYRAQGTKPAIKPAGVSYMGEADVDLHSGM